MGSCQKMKIIMGIVEKLSVFVVFAVVAVHCLPQVNFVNYENVRDAVNKYHFAFETQDGIKRVETGEIFNPDSDDSKLVVQGDYFINGAGNHHTAVNFVADDRGYRPVVKISFGNFLSADPVIQNSNFERTTLNENVNSERRSDNVERNYYGEESVTNRFNKRRPETNVIKRPNYSEPKEEIYIDSDLSPSRFETEKRTYVETEDNDKDSPFLN